jgi:predicted transcriptional regulator of viral defense system
MRGKPAKELAIATLADAQHGIVARRQLMEAGLSGDDVDRRIRARRLRRLHRGVYAVGHRTITADARWIAAVLSAGPGAVLSDASAAMAWDMRRSASGVIHVTVATRSGRDRRPGVRIHRRKLTAQDVTIHRSIPITTPARTVVDLARTLQGRALEALIDRAYQRGLVDFDELRAAGGASLKAALAKYQAPATRSELEERFLQLCDDAGIPRPETNVRIEGFEVDFVWPTGA